MLGYARIAIILILAMALAACGANGDDETDDTTDEPTAVEETQDDDAADDADEAESDEDEEASEDDDGDDADAGGDANELVWADGVEITTLDGPFVTDLVTEAILDAIFEKLVTFAPDMSIEPQLAQDWEVADDDLTWTFTLREDAVFSSGNPVTAEAIKFSLDRARSEETAAPNRSVLTAIDQVNVVDDSTVEIVTAEPFPDLLQALADRASIIHDPENVEQYDDPRDVGLNPVGSGPYQLAEWETGINVVLERNPEYAGEQPAIDRIEYRTVPEAGTRMSMIQTGEADLISAPVLDDLDDLRDNPDVEVMVEEGLLLVNFEIRMDAEHVDDPLVRQAMNYAVDKDAIINDLLDGLATPHCSPLTRGIGPDFFIEVNCWEYDPDQATDLLEEAGYADGFEMEMWCPSGRYLKDREICEAVQAYLSAVGIQADLQTFEWATYTELWSDPDRTMWMIGRAAGFTDFIFNRMFMEDQMDSGANNNTRFSDERVTELVQLGRSTFDVEERAEYYHEIQEIVSEQAPYLTLHTENIIKVHRSNVTGLEVLPKDVVILSGIDKE